MFINCLVSVFSIYGGLTRKIWWFIAKKMQLNSLWYHFFPNDDLEREAGIEVKNTGSQVQIKSLTLIIK